MIVRVKLNTIHDERINFGTSNYLDLSKAKFWNETTV